MEGQAFTPPGVRAVVAGTQTCRNGTLLFANSPTVTFGMANSSVITASAVGGGTGGGGADGVNIIAAGTQTAATTGTVLFSNSNGVTFGMSNSSVVTASYSQSAVGFSAQGGSSVFQTLSFSNANGISFSNNAGQVQASYTVPTVTNSSITLSDTATSMTLARLAFTNSNGLTLTLSTGAGGSATVIGSYTVPTVTNSSLTVSDNATSGTAARLAFTNLNGVTLSLSTGAGGSHTIVGSHNALTSQSNQAFSALGGSSAFQTLSFSNANGISFSNNAGQVQASYTVPTVTNSSLTLSDTATSMTIAQLAFTNSNGLTMTLSTGAGGSATLIGSYTQSGQAFSASGGSSTFSTLSFSDNAQASFTNNAGQLAVTNVRMSMSASGNTTQSSTNTANLSQMTFDAQGMLSVGVSGGSIRYSAYPLLSTLRVNQVEGMQSGTNSMGNLTSMSVRVYPFQIQQGVSAGAFGFPISISMVTNSGTDAQTWGVQAAIYTRGTGASTSQLNSWWSSSFSIGHSWSNTSTLSFNQPTSTNFAGFTTGGTSSAGSNITSQYSGAKLIEWPMSSIVTPGHYWLAVCITASSNLTSAGIAASMIGVQVNNNQAFTGLSPIGSLSSAYSTGMDPYGGRELMGLGSWSASGGVPASMAISQIKAGETLVPVMHFWST